jgi:hypothetical protein
VDHAWSVAPALIAFEDFEEGAMISDQNLGLQIKKRKRSSYECTQINPTTRELARRKRCSAVIELRCQELFY